jgi:uncharacterized protein YndB with AHSA1/START domain
MSPIVSTIEIARPPEEVYAYATDPSRFAEWQTDVVSVRLEGPPLTVGTRYATTRRIGATQRSMIQEVVEVVPDRRWAVRGVDGPIRPSASITVEALDGGTRSRVTFSLDFEGHGIGVPMVPLVRRMAARGAPLSYRNFKERLETPPS